MSKKVLLVGPSRAGKDEAGDWLATHTSAVYGGTTSKFLLPYVAAAMGMSDRLEECYQQRHENKVRWFDIGNELRASDPGILLRAALAHGNVIAGVRDECEIINARENSLVDVIVWIDNPRVPPDPTLKFTEDDCDMTIPNWTDLTTYHRRLAVFAKLCGFAVKEMYE